MSATIFKLYVSLIAVLDIVDIHYYSLILKCLIGKWDETMFLLKQTDYFYSGNYFETLVGTLCLMMNGNS